MAEPASRPTAQRLSEDIGDVLSAIRRLIAEDASVPARGQGTVSSPIATESPWSTRAQSEPATEDEPAWPFGAFANAPGAPKPKARSAEIFSDWLESQGVLDPQSRSDATVLDIAQDATPLRLTDADRATPYATPDPLPVLKAATVVHSDDEDAFAEAFDWKARMRPEQPPAPVILNAHSATPHADPVAQPIANDMIKVKDAGADFGGLLCSLPWLDLASTSPSGADSEVCASDQADCGAPSDDPAAFRADDSVDESDMHKALRLIIREELARALADLGRNSPRTDPADSLIRVPI